MKTAEPPEPLTFLHSEIILFKQILQQIGGPAARHFVYSVYSVDFSEFVSIRVHSWFLIIDLLLGNIRHKNAAGRHMDRLAERFVAQQPSFARAEFATREFRADRDGHIVAADLVGRRRIARNA